MTGNGHDSSSGKGSDPRSSGRSSDRSFRHTPEHDPNVGTVFGGRYRVEEQIGVGGMGVVYKATHTGLDRTVVVKLLSRERLEDEASVKRFEREAKTLSRLDHSNIVTVHDFGYQDETSYIVMEYVDGYQLDQLVKQNEALGYELFVTVASQILDAVGQAHREGLVHRDLKPGNIMLTERHGEPNFVKVLDFGLAKLVSGEEDVTKQDSLVGSMPYLSPEQIRGDEIDQRVDVYALGILFYFALTGRKPFRGTNASILYDQVHSDPPPLHLHVPNPEVIPEGIFELVERCLAKDPQDRPADAHAVLEELQQITGTPLPLQSSETGARGGRARRSTPTPGGTEGESSSTELLGRVQDTSDRVELHRQRAGQREIEHEPEGDPTQQLNSVEEIPREPTDEEAWWGDPSTLITVGSLLVVIGGAVFWFVTNPGGEAAAPTPEPIEKKKAEAEQEATVPKQLGRVEKLLERGEIDQAQALVESVISTHEDADEFEEELSAKQQLIHTARLYRRARQAQKVGNIGEAIDLLKDVVRNDESYRDARRRLDELRDYGRVSIVVVEGARVKVDGEEVGKAPLETWVKPGEHSIEIEADGYETWSNPLRIAHGEAVSLEPELEEGSSAAPPPKPEESAESENGSASDSSYEPSNSSDDGSQNPEEESSGEQTGSGDLFDKQSDSPSEGDSAEGETDDFELFPHQ
mgnify:CR=1 FL=1